MTKSVAKGSMSINLLLEKIISNIIKKIQKIKVQKCPTFERFTTLNAFDLGQVPELLDENIALFL